MISITAVKMSLGQSEAVYVIPAKQVYKSLSMISMFSGASRVKADSLRNTRWAPDSSCYEPEGASHEYPGLPDDPGGPTDELDAIADSPIDMFFYFMPKEVWQDIADESNRYRHQKTRERAANLQAKQQAQATPRGRSVDSQKAIRDRLRKKAQIMPFEIVVSSVFVGVLGTFRGDVPEAYDDILLHRVHQSEQRQPCVPLQ